MGLAYCGIGIVYRGWELAAIGGRGSSCLALSTRINSVIAAPRPAATSLSLTTVSIQNCPRPKRPGSCPARGKLQSLQSDLLGNALPIVLRTAACRGTALCDPRSGFIEVQKANCSRVGEQGCCALECANTTEQSSDAEGQEPGEK